MESRTWRGWCRTRGRFTGFDDKIVAMYARDMTVREIQDFLAEMYSVDVSPDLITIGAWCNAMAALGIEL